MSAFGVRTIGLDLPPLAVRFGQRLHEVGVTAGVERAAAFAQALTLVRPVSRSRLYWTARAAFVTDRGQLPAFDAVFAEVFGSGGSGAAPELDEGRSGEVTAVSPAPRRREARREAEQEITMPTLASDEELLRSRRFESLDPEELAQLYALMARMRIAAPTRLSRRARRDRHGRRTDLRRTLRASMRTGGDPVRLARRRRRAVPRRIVMLCDISGSMEPYARAYLQFLASASGSALRAGGPVEAFVFATRLTRLTRALRSRNPEQAIQRAAAAAPDWSSGTRIGEALRRFNDRYGRRGMARGAIVVILSDGWERGDPALVEREMRRMARLAYRIIWVNPRAAARDFAPRAAGMAAALPYLDALVSGESLAALHEVVRAIACAPGELPRIAGAAAAGSSEVEVESSGEEEPWGSATPVRGSSVAMPSGWSPSRGRTTPGW